MYTRSLISLLLLVVFGVVALAQQPAAQQPAAPQAPAKQAPPVVKTHLKVGDPAPDFKLRATDGNTYTLSDFKGKKNVVLAIYVLAFTGG